MCDEWLCYCSLGGDGDMEKDLNSSAPTHKGRAFCSGQCVCFRVHCQLVQITQKGIVQWVVGVFQGTLSAGTAVCTRRGEPRSTGGENVSHQQQPVQLMLMEAIVLVCS